MSDQTTMTPREFWNGKFAGDDYLYGTAPNVWLAAQVEHIQAGDKALVIADGEGRNGVWLAERGLEVTTVDAAPRGIEKAEALAASRGVSLHTACADLTTWQWPQAAFDLAVSIFAHFRAEVRPAIHAKLLAALKPGGVLLLEAYNPYQHIYKTGGPPLLEMLYTAYTLQQDFAEAEILQLEETLAERAEGAGHKGTSALVRLIARRR